MIETRDVTVDDKRYSVTQFSATKGTKILTRLTMLLGEPLSVFMADQEADAQKVLPVAISALCARLDEDVVVNTLKELMDGVRDENGPIQFDTHFAGRFGHMFKLLPKILEVQYGDFLGVLFVAAGSKQILPTMKAKTKTR